MKKLILIFCVFGISLAGSLENTLFAQQGIFMTSSAKRGTGKDPKWPCGETSEDTIQSIQNYWENIQYVPPYDFCDKIAVCFELDTIDNLTIAKIDIPFRLNDSVYNFRNQVSNPDTDFAIKIIPKDHMGNVLNIYSTFDLSKVTQPSVLPNSNGWFELINNDTAAKKISGLPRLFIDITNLSTPSMVIDVEFLLGYLPKNNPSTFISFQQSQVVMSGPMCLFPGTDPIYTNADNNLRVSQSSILSEKFQTQVFPNPIENRFSVKFNDFINSEITIELYDLNGKLLFRKIQFMDTGKSSISLTENDWGVLPKGIFILKVSGEGFSHNHKLTKI